jgi:ribbon-helix-helix CopG family protein
MYMALKRKQIYVDPESDRKIKKLARATGLPESEHIRRAIASYVSGIPDSETPDHPLLRMIGICDSPRGPKDAAVRHDKYLYGRKK